MKSKKPNIAVLAIDAQNSFCNKSGSLYVPGAEEDMERASSFIIDNRANINSIYATFDMHSPMQIFHQKWWKDSSGTHPKPFTIITSKEVEDGRWIPVIEKDKSLNYLKQLEEQSNFPHCIWPEHCLMGTWGSLMCSSVLEAVNAWQADYGSMVNVDVIYKGKNPIYEFFGIFKPQVFIESDSYTHFNNMLVLNLNKHDVIYAFGEAESHCFGLSIKQLLDRAEAGDDSCGTLLKKMVILEDCTSSISGFEGNMDEVINLAMSKYGLRVENHKIDILSALG